MDLFVNIRANLADLSAGMAQMRAMVQQTSTQIGQSMAGAFGVDPNAISSVQAYRSNLIAAGAAVTALSAAMTQFTLGSVNIFAKQEQAFAGVRKTINATEAEFGQIKDALTDLSNRTPVPFEDLAKIGELAGQLGVRGVDNLTKFTETIARVTVSTNLSAETAAKAFARISNIMGDPIANVDRLASSVVDLGNNFATTETEITTFSLRIAGAGKIANLTTPDILGIGAAFSSVGIAAEAGGTAVQKMMVEMTRAVATGSDKLRLFAMLAGQTREEFSKSFQTRPVEAFIKVMEGLKSAGDGAFAFLEGIVGNEARFLRAMLSTANAGDLLRKAVERSNIAYEQNIALQKESDQRFNTFTNILKMVANAWENLRASLAEGIMPILRPLAKGVATVVEAFQAIPAPVKQFIALVAGLVTSAAALTAAWIAGKLALAGLLAVLAPLGISLVGVAVASAKIVAVFAAIVLTIQGLVAAYNYLTDSSTKSGQAAGQAAEQSASAWTSAAQDIKDVWRGLVEVAKDAGKAIASATSTAWATVKDDTKRDLETIKSVSASAWDTIVTDIQSDLGVIGDFLEKLGLKDFFVNLGKELYDFLSTMLKGFVVLAEATLKPFKDAWEWLRTRGKTARETEAANQREATNETLREQARGNSIQQRAEADNKRILNLIDEEKYKESIRLLGLETQDRLSALDLTQTAVKNSVAVGLATEREGVQAQLGLLQMREDITKGMYGREMDLALRVGKDSQQRQDEAVRKFKTSMVNIEQERMNLNTTLTKLDQDEAKAWAANLTEQEKAAEEAAYSIGQTFLKLSNDLKALDFVSDAERNLRGFEVANAEMLNKIEEDKKKLTVGSSEYEQALLAEAKAYDLLNKQIDTYATQGLQQAQREMVAAAASFGLIGQEAYKVQVSITAFGKSYDDLTESQKRYVDGRSATLAYLDEQKKAVDAIKVAQDLWLAGMEEQTAIGRAFQAQSIQDQQARLDTTIKVNDLIIHAEQERAMREARILQQEGQLHRDYYQFLTGTIEGYAARLPDIFEGMATAITNTFDNMQKTLSDVFFNLFTGQTIKLQDVWKSMLQAMLRELANFLASGTVKFFLEFLGRTMQGQGTGEAASGAFGSLFGGQAASSGTGGVVSSGTSILGALAGLIGGRSGSSGPVSSGTSGSTYTLGGSTRLTDPTAGFSLPSALQSSDAFSTDFTNLFGTGYNISDVTTEYFSTGGQVPGSGRGDTVPAMLEPGEFVVRRAAAQPNLDALSALNRGGQARVYAGGAYMADGGVVPSITGDQALVNLLYAIYKQQVITAQATQATAVNTQGTAQAVGEIAGAQVPTAGVTQITGTGANITPVTSVAGGTQATTTTASGGSSSGSGSGLSTSDILGLLKGGTNLTRTGSNIVMGLTDTSKLTAQNINAALGLLSGGVGLASGISSGNTLQAAGGGITALSGLAGLSGVQSYLNSTFGSNLIGAGSTAIGAGQITSSALGIAGGGLGLYASITDMIKNGASASGVVNALLSAYSVYAGAAPVITAVTGQSLPTVGSLVSGLIGTEVAASAAPGITAATTAGVTGGELALGATAETGAVVAGEAIGGSAAATFAVVLAPIIVGYLANAIGEMVARGQAMKQAVARYKGLAAAVPEYLQGMQTLAQASAAFDPVVATPQQAQTLYKAIGDFTYAYRQNGVEDFIKFGTTVGAGNYKDVQIDFQQSDQVLAMLAPMQQAIRLGAIRALDVIGRAGVAIPAVPAGSGFYTDPAMLALSQIPTNTGAVLPGTLASGQTLLLPGYTQAASPFSNSQGLMYNVSNSLWTGITSLQPGGLESGIASLAGSTTAGAFTPMSATQAIQAVQTANTLSMGPVGPIYTEAFNSAITGGADLAGAQQVAAMAQQDAYQAFTSGGGQTGGWVPGTTRGDSFSTMLEPGEFVVRRDVAQRNAPLLEGLNRGGGFIGGKAATGGWVPRVMAGGNVRVPTQGGRPMQGPVSMPVNIAITVNGNVDDPRELVERLAPVLRDQLKRIDTRYSRAGNKTQV